MLHFFAFSNKASGSALRVSGLSMLKRISLRSQGSFIGQKPVQTGKNHKQ